MDFKQGRRKVKAQTQASPHTTSCIKIMALTLWKSQNSKALTISCDRNLAFTSIITTTQVTKQLTQTRESN
jgi:hypothetical protein